MAIRVFLVDDSANRRKIWRHIFEGDEEFVVVGEAKNGKVAIKQIPSEEVDIVLMASMMPVMDGFDATRWLMENNPLPVLLVSEQSNSELDSERRAAEVGALGLIDQPSADELTGSVAVNSVCRTIRISSQVPVVTRRHTSRGRNKKNAPSKMIKKTAPISKEAPSRASLIMIGASTGGPAALARVLLGLPRPLPWPVILIQHITLDFAQGMAQWLAKISGHDVRLVEESIPLRDGVVLVAPDCADLVVEGDWVDIRCEPGRSRSYASIDRALKSAAHSSLTSETVGILLTGMGSDGAEGLKSLRQRGGWTIAQDRDSSIVWGMPRVAAEIDAACQVLSLDAIIEFLNTLSGTGRFDSE